MVLMRGKFIKYYIKYFDEEGNEIKSKSPSEIGIVHSIRRDGVITIVTLDTVQPIINMLNRTDIGVLKVTDDLEGMFKDEKRVSRTKRRI